MSFTKMMAMPANLDVIENNNVESIDKVEVQRRHKYHAMNFYYYI